MTRSCLPARPAAYIRCCESGLNLAVRTTIPLYSFCSIPPRGHDDCLNLHVSSNRTMFALPCLFCQSKAVKRSASPLSRRFALASTLCALVNIWAHHSSADAPSAKARFENSPRPAGPPPIETLAELSVGQAGHAFDHLRAIGRPAAGDAGSGAKLP